MDRPVAEWLQEGMPRSGLRREHTAPLGATDTAIARHGGHDRDIMISHCSFAEVKHTNSRNMTNSGDVQMDYSGKRVRASHGSYRCIRAYLRIQHRKRSYRGAMTDAPAVLYVRSKGKGD